MAVKWINWAWGVKVGNPTRKLVLVALADHANADGVCWPSMEHIAVLAECSTRSVSRHIEALEEMGLAERQRRVGKKGQFAGYEYTLVDAGKATESSGQDDRPSESPPDSLSGGDDVEEGSPPDDILSAGQSVRRSESQPPPDTVSPGPPDTESGPITEEPSVDLEPSENRHGGGFPTRAGDGRIVDAILDWADDAGHVRRVDPDRPVESFAWALQLTEDDLGRGTTFDRIGKQLIVEYLEQIEGVRPEPSAITHINRLAGSHGAPLTLRAVAEALDNGAGADAEYAGDARAVIKYATAVIQRWRREGSAA